MEAIIPQKSIRLFSKIISCMSKIGEELFIEATDEKLVLRTLNAARSAFASFQLHSTFFDGYKLSRAAARCKVQLKPCVAVFKTMNNVERCTLRLDDSDNTPRLTFDLLCKLGIKKIYRLTYEDVDTLQAIYSKEACPNKILSKTKILQDAIQNFHTNVEEVTLIPSKNGIKLRSFFEDQKVIVKTLHTDLSLNCHDFEEYTYVEAPPSEITFTLKELKAILAFGESATVPISVHFEKGGRPITFSINFYNSLQADFVMATLLDQQTSQPADGTAPAAAKGTPSSSPAGHSSAAASPASGGQPRVSGVSALSPVNTNTDMDVARTGADRSDRSDSDRVGTSRAPKRPVPPPANGSATVVPPAPQKKPAPSASSDSRHSSGEEEMAEYQPKKPRTAPSGPIKLPQPLGTARKLWVNKGNDDDDDDEDDPADDDDAAPS